MATTTADTEPTSCVKEEYIPLQPLTYTGAVPRPCPACTEPTPDQQVRDALKEREEQLKLKDVTNGAKHTSPPPSDSAASASPSGTARNSTVEQLKEGAAEAAGALRSLVSQLSLSVEKVTNDMTVKAHSQARAISQQQGYDRFMFYFGSELVAGQGEVLLADYSCSAMHNGTKVEGYLFITRNYLCFAAEFNSYLTNAAEAFKQAVAKDLRSSLKDLQTAAAAPRVVGVKQVIPLKNVASVVPSVVLPTVGNGAPYFLPLPADYVVPSALQVYEKEEHKLFQFLAFDSLTAKAGSALSGIVKGSPLDRAYNYLDHAWREAVKVPLDGVDYA